MLTYTIASQITKDFRTFEPAPHQSQGTANNLDAGVKDEILRAVDSKVERYDCWRSGEKAEVIPSKVLILNEAKDDAELKGSKVVGQALEQIFEDAEHDLDIVAFCP